MGWFKMQGLIYSRKKFHFAICNLMEYKETGKALYINTDVSTSEAFLCSCYLNGDQEWYCSVGLLFVYNTLFETRCQNRFPGLVIEFCRLTLHCVSFFLKNSPSFEIFKSSCVLPPCGKGLFFCFFKFQVWSLDQGTKASVKLFSACTGRILSIPCAAINDQNTGVSKFGPMVLWIPELMAMKYCTVNANCQGWQFNLLNIYTETLLFFLKLCHVSQPRPGTAQRHIPHAVFSRASLLNLYFPLKGI